MNADRKGRSVRRPLRAVAVLALVGAGLAGLMGLAGVAGGAGLAWAGDAERSFGLEISGNGQTTPADVGLPVYEGARPFSESSGDRPSASLGAWAGSFGLQLHVMKFRADAAPNRVADFYLQALRRYGEVLDCREASARVKPPKEESERLSCDERSPKPGAFEYRVGTRKNFRVVSVRPDGDGSRFDMARIQLGR